MKVYFIIVSNTTTTTTHCITTACEFCGAQENWLGSSPVEARQPYHFQIQCHTEATATATMAIKSIKYERYLHVLNLALTKAREQVDIEAIVQEFYGEDGGDTQVFGELLGSILDQQVTAAVKADMMEWFQEIELEETLTKFEAAIEKAKRDEEKKKKMEEKDKHSTTAAVASVKVPTSPSGLVRQRMYKRCVTLQSEIEQEIATLEKEIVDLEAQQKNHDGENIVSQVEQLGKKTLERTASDYASVTKK